MDACLTIANWARGRVFAPIRCAVPRDWLIVFHSAKGFHPNHAKSEKWITQMRSKLPRAIWLARGKPEAQVQRSVQKNIPTVPAKLWGCKSQQEAQAQTTASPTDSVCFSCSCSSKSKTVWQEENSHSSATRSDLPVRRARVRRSCVPSFGKSRPNTLSTMMGCAAQWTARSQWPEKNKASQHGEISRRARFGFQVRSQLSRVRRERVIRKQNSKLPMPTRLRLRCPID